MKPMKIGNTPLEASRIALGCMRLSDNRDEAVNTIKAALDGGINFFDHADIYGGGKREEVFAAIWDEIPGIRDRIVVQSKCGIRSAPQRFDFSYEHIVQSVDGSLSRLKTDYLDVLLLHRPDTLVEPEEVARAFDHLEQGGKVRFFGVSNHTAPQIQFLQKWVNQPLAANQLQLSVVHTHLIDEGIVMNRSDYPQPTRGEGTLEFCRMQDITIQAWSPLASGIVSGKSLEAPDERIKETAALVAKLAEEKGVSQTAIVIAWLLRHPARIQPIIGTTNPTRIAGACQADDIELTREEWYGLFIAGRGKSLP
ncbi:aldo/keto reductase family oxidoreductase [Candidatus Poribacteria bacterium]